MAISFPRSADPPLDAAAVDWAIRGGILCINDADELCRRVLTTSSGHVTTAPAVPAILEKGKEKELVSQSCSGICVQLNLLNSLNSLLQSIQDYYRNLPKIILSVSSENKNLQQL